MQDRRLSAQLTPQKTSVPAMQIGNTPFYRSPFYEGRCKNGPEVWVKDESTNMGGTFKARAREILLLHLKLSYSRRMRRDPAEAADGTNARAEEPKATDQPKTAKSYIGSISMQILTRPLLCQEESITVGIVQITSGNSGLVLGELAQKHSSEKVRFEVVNIISKDLPPSVKRTLRKCSHVVEVDLSAGILGPTELLELAHKKTGIQLDRIHHVETITHLGGYPEIISEVADAGVKPRYVFCPGGAGELAVTLAETIKTTWTDAPPPTLVVCVPEEHVLTRPDMIFQKNIPETSADKLATPHAVYAARLQQLRDEGRVQMLEVSEEELKAEIEALRKTHIAAEPSAAVAFAGAKKFGFAPNDVAVIVNTGKGNCQETAFERRIRHTKKWIKSLALVATIYLTAITISTGYLITKRNHLREQSYIYEGLVSNAEHYIYRNRGLQSTLEALKNACINLRGRRPNCQDIHFVGEFSTTEIELLGLAGTELNSDRWLAQMSYERFRAYSQGVTYHCVRLSQQICQSNQTPYEIWYRDYGSWVKFLNKATFGVVDIGLY